MIYYLHCFHKKVKKTITDNNAQYKILIDTYRKRVVLDVDDLVWALLSRDRQGYAKKPNREKINYYNFEKTDRFSFISRKPKKPNRNRKNGAKLEKNLAKPEKNELNRFEHVFVLKNRTNFF
jgi:hypothetical protein